MKLYSSKSNATKAARKVCGSGATDGIDFETMQDDAGKWGWIDLRESTTDAAASENDAESVKAESEADAAASGADAPTGGDASVSPVEDDAGEGPAAPDSSTDPDALMAAMLGDDVSGALMAHADAVSAEKAKATPAGASRKRATAAAWKAAEAGKFPPPLTVESEKNAYTQGRFTAIYETAANIDESMDNRVLNLLEIRAKIKGTNTYAKRQRDYIDAYLRYFEVQWGKDFVDARRAEHAATMETTDA